MNNAVVRSQTSSQASEKSIYNWTVGSLYPWLHIRGFNQCRLESYCSSDLVTQTLCKWSCILNLHC